MRILIVGATGFIGSAAAARLSAQGHQIVAVSRSKQPLGLMPATILKEDVAQATDPADWLPHLAGVDAVVNCAGTLQDGPRNSTAGVHVRGPVALFKACEITGIRRVVHLSAVGVDRATPTAFSRTKLAGDQALMALDLDWVILRPSVVVGRGAYGGSALLRGLAALPIMPLIPAAGALQLVHSDDLVAAIEFFLQPNAPSHIAMDGVGPRLFAFADAVRLFRRWLRWPEAPAVRLPSWAANAAYPLGDLVALLGWRPPVRSTARSEIMRGAVGDPARLPEVAGLKLTDIEATWLPSRPPFRNAGSRGFIS